MVRKKVHIALVGGQPVPIYIGICDDNLASHVVLVCSEDSHEEALRIKGQFPRREVQICKCPTKDLSVFEATAQKLMEAYADCEVVLNLTSGLKLWLIAFYRIFLQHPSAHFVYIDQTNTITDLLTKQTHVGEIDKMVRFELYGTPLTDFLSLDEYTKEDFATQEQIARFRSLDKREFGNLTAQLAEANPTEEIQLNGSTHSMLHYDPVTHWAEMEMQDYRSGKNVRREFQSPHLWHLLTNAGWFELKVAHALRQVPEVKEVWLNCKFADLHGEPKNEIDIIADLGHRLLFVECKTMIYDSTDIDKFRSAVRNFSGMSTLALFVVNDKPSPKKKPLYEHAMEKCRDNNIETFNFSDHPNQSLQQIITKLLGVQNKR